MCVILHIAHSVQLRPIIWAKHRVFSNCSELDIVLGRPNVLFSQRWSFLSGILLISRNTDWAALSSKWRLCISHLIVAFWDSHRKQNDNPKRFNTKMLTKSHQGLSCVKPFTILGTSRWKCILCKHINLKQFSQMLYGAPINNLRFCEPHSVRSCTGMFSITLHGVNYRSTQDWPTNLTAFSRTALTANCSQKTAREITSINAKSKARLFLFPLFPKRRWILLKETNWWKLTTSRLK